MAFQIRDLKESDAPAIFEVLEAARAASRVSIGPQWSAGQLVKECRERGLVAADGGAIRAFILWRVTGASWEVSFLATDPNAQRQGLMSSLLEQMKRTRPQDQPIWLEVHEQNRTARALYAKAGFIEAGQRPHYYADGGTAILYNYG